MTYADVNDVQALNRARVIGQGDNPNESDVLFYLEVTAAEIDAILLDKGYQLPIPSEATSAWNMLRRINAQGAAMEMEQASPSSRGADRYKKIYEESLAMLRTADLVMNVPKADGRAKPRGPGVTTPPGARTNVEYERMEAEVEDGRLSEPLGFSIPYFRRGMRF